MKKHEKRNLSFKDIEVRSIFEETSGKKFVEGIIPYNSRSVPMWGITELISKTAFRKTLSDGAEVKALWSHDEQKILGNTRSGTLALENAENGLICRCELPDTSYANDLYEVIKRGDCTTMSFGFLPVKWTDDAEAKTRTLREVNLKEVSFGVAFPAYPETNSATSLRALRSTLNLENLNEILEKDSFGGSDILTIRDAINAFEFLLRNNGEAAEEGKPAEEATSQEENDTLPVERKDVEREKLLSLRIKTEMLYNRRD